MIVVCLQYEFKLRPQGRQAFRFELFPGAFQCHDSIANCLSQRNRLRTLKKVTNVRLVFSAKQRAHQPIQVAETVYNVVNRQYREGFDRSVSHLVLNEFTQPSKRSEITVSVREGI